MLKWPVSPRRSARCWVLNAGVNPAQSQTTNPPLTTPHPARPTPPTRDPHTPGYVTATELPDGIVPPADADGNFIIGPTHDRASELTVNTNVPQGTVYDFTMSSADSKIYPGIAREPNTFGTPDTNDPVKLIVTTSHPAPYTRHVSVYVPKQYVPGTAAPFIVGADSPDKFLFTALGQSHHAEKSSVMIAISIGNGSGDAPGQRARTGIRHHVRPVCGIRGARSATARGKPMQRDLDQKPRRARDDGLQFRRLMRVDHGVVSSGPLPPRSDLFGHLCGPAVAA